MFYICHVHIVLVWKVKEIIFWEHVELLSSVIWDKAKQKREDMEESLVGF